MVFGSSSADSLTSTVLAEDFSLGGLLVLGGSGSGVFSATKFSSTLAAFLAAPFLPFLSALRGSYFFRFSRSAAASSYFFFFSGSSSLSSSFFAGAAFLATGGLGFGVGSDP